MDERRRLAALMREYGLSNQHKNFPDGENASHEICRKVDGGESEFSVRIRQIRDTLYMVIAHVYRATLVGASVRPFVCRARDVGEGRSENA